MVSWRGLEPATLCLKGAWTASKASLNSILFLISVAHFYNAQIVGGGQQVCPAYLKKIEMVGLRLARESTRQNERRRHTVAGQCFEARGYAGVREVDPRSAVQRIEPIFIASADLPPSVPKQQPAALIGSECSERLGLRGPLPASGSIKVSPLGERSADLQAVSCEPAKLVRLLNQSSAIWCRQVCRRERGTRVRC